MSPRQRTNARFWGSILFPDLVAIYSMSQEKVAERLALEEELGQNQKPLTEAEKNAAVAVPQQEAK